MLEVVLHQNPAKYPCQKVMVVEVADSAFLACFAEGAPHQTLITSVLHKYASGNFPSKSPRPPSAASDSTRAGLVGREGSRIVVIRLNTARFA